MTDLARSAKLYRDGLGLERLGSFEDHDGFDGVMLGVPGGRWHVELTHCRAHPVRPQPTPEDLVVLYVPGADDWRAACDRMEAAGFARVPSLNPYWDVRGRTFEDPDGYRIVIENASWRSGGVPFEIREGYLPGAIGRIAGLHGAWYAEHAGFGVYFESKVARELGEFCERCTQGRDGLWLAVRDGSVEGSIAIDGAHAGADGAHLRWFIVSDALRGTGVGRSLLARAVDFCRARHGGRAYLWTFRGLDAAAHLYREHGFRLAEERPGHQWGREVIEQRYVLEAR